MAIIGTPLYSKKVKCQNCAAFPLVFAYVFGVKNNFFMYVIEIKLIAIQKYVF
jgi:hypothetical protein